MSSDIELTDYEISSTETDTDNDGSDLPDLDKGSESDADEDLCVVGEDGLEIDFSKEGSDVIVIEAEENPTDIPPPVDKPKGPKLL